MLSLIKKVTNREVKIVKYSARNKMAKDARAYRTRTVTAIDAVAILSTKEIHCSEGGTCWSAVCDEK